MGRRFFYLCNVHQADWHPSLARWFHHQGERVWYSDGRQARHDGTSEQWQLPEQHERSEARDEGWQRSSSTKPPLHPAIGDGKQGRAAAWFAQQLVANVVRHCCHAYSCSRNFGSWLPM